MPNPFRHVRTSPQLRGLLPLALLSLALFAGCATGPEPIGEPTANLGDEAQPDAVSSSSREDIEPIWVAREFLIAHFEDDAEHAVTVFAADARVTFDIPESHALGGPHGGAILSGQQLAAWVTNHLVGTRIIIRVETNCEMGNRIVIDLNWGREDQQLPVRFQFDTRDGYIQALLITEQFGSVPCQE